MKVKMFGTLRSAVGHTKEIKVRVEDGSTVLEVLETLFVDYPGLERKVIVADNTLQGGVNLFVNGRSVRFLGGLTTVLRQSDELALFPPIAGG